MAVEYECCETGFFTGIVVGTLLVLFAGLMSGLRSMRPVDLEVIAESGAPTPRKQASKILPVGRRQHLLLCTLLICKSAAREALSIFLGSLVTAWGDFLISVTLILLVGEIIPQAVSSRHGLVIGAKVATFVQILVWICFPVAYPISKVLDFWLGEGNGVPFRRTELKTLVDLHGNEAGKGGELTRDETRIIGGALELGDKTARDAMTPMSETFAIDINAKLDSNLMGLILEKGFSRVPVYYQHPTNIIGLLLVKNLLTILPEEEVPVKNVSIRRIPGVFETMPLSNILKEFRKGHSHMAVVIRQLRDAEHATEERDVTVDIDGEDIDGESHLKEKCLKSKRSHKKKNSLSQDANLHRGASKSKKWTRDLHSEVLHFTYDPLGMTPGESEVIGIITLEDVIEQLLKEEIYDEIDYHAETNN